MLTAYSRPTGDYCDVYLTHDSMSVRKAHNAGRNHLRNVLEYYQQIGHEKAQSVIDSITNSYAAEGQAAANPMLQQGAPGSYLPPPPYGFPGRPGQMPPPPFGFPPGAPPPPGGVPPPGGRGMPFPPPFPPPSSSTSGAPATTTSTSLPPPPLPNMPPGSLPFPPPPGGFPPNFQAPPPGAPGFPPAPGQQQGGAPGTSSAPPGAPGTTSSAPPSGPPGQTSSYSPPGTAPPPGVSGPPPDTPYVLAEQHCNKNSKEMKIESIYVMIRVRSIHFDSNDFIHTDSVQQPITSYLTDFQYKTNTNKRKEQKAKPKPKPKKTQFAVFQTETKKKNTIFRESLVCALSPPCVR
ncbi:U1 small nuclear ribonucleoprotein C [Rasamsonia emersonii CBS 393.64]|uniref:U1 small nuclear ribonucleoprotein C n=1 Tax=Rasamsonia emersonii (strain ATCC 16479 / CBS 393.64 / IMI 116815) TaxID=1408163 RepID=A0A0F4YNQ3_RASE3|nr:U1 small nuclear ribonucleoprotein C [Rasamsonia emersonii CBS 393.64]KKA19897.1 U1 small nuclear ribonucleoprotein C [Rasamsonia emersonii CBS 393.64]